MRPQGRYFGALTSDLVLPLLFFFRDEPFASLVFLKEVHLERQGVAEDRVARVALVYATSVVA